MKFDQMILPPASQELLEKIEELVLIPSYNQQHLTISSFEGSGNRSLLLYLLRNHKFIDSFPENQLFTWFDLNTFTGKTSNLFIDSMSYIESTFEKSLTPDLKLLIKAHLLKTQVTEPEFKDFLNKLTFEFGFRIAICINGADELYKNRNESRKIRSFIIEITHLNPKNISFIFMNQSELPFIEKPSMKDEFDQIFNQKVVWGNSLTYDDVSTRFLLQNITNEDLKFNDSYYTRLALLAHGDPTLQKYIVQNSMTDSHLEGLITSNKSTIEVYESMDKNWLENRYQRIIQNLSQKSLNNLINASTTDNSRYLINTGLLQAYEGKICYLNPIFEYYVSKYSKSLSINDADFTAKETLVYDLLNNNISSVISKDEIAKSIWGEEWTEKYSDWAIDKIVSNIRRKLKEKGSLEVIKSSKGTGYLLTNN